MLLEYTTVSNPSLPSQTPFSNDGKSEMALANIVRMQKMYRIADDEHNTEAVHSPPKIHQPSGLLSLKDRYLKGEVEGLAS